MRYNYNNDDWVFTILASIPIVGVLLVIGLVVFGMYYSLF